MELTKKLAEFVHDTNFHDIPQDVIEKKVSIAFLTGLEVPWAE